MPPLMGNWKTSKPYSILSWFTFFSLQLPFPYQCFLSMVSKTGNSNKLNNVREHRLIWNDSRTCMLLLVEVLPKKKRQLYIYPFATKYFCLMVKKPVVPLFFQQLDLFLWQIEWIRTVYLKGFLAQSLHFAAAATVMLGKKLVSVKAWQ